MVWYPPAPAEERKKRRTAQERDQDSQEVRWSEFVGVCWNKRARKWATQARVDGKTIYLGYFSSEEEAARKYDEHAKSLGRPVNFPTDDSQVQAQKCAPRVHRQPKKAKAQAVPSAMPNAPRANASEAGVEGAEEEPPAEPAAAAAPAAAATPAAPKEEKKKTGKIVRA